MSLLLGIEMTELKDKKILLVDDEVDILNLLEAVLIKENFINIYKAVSGSPTAIENGQRDYTGHHCLDIMLPDVFGFSVCKRS